MGTLSTIQCGGLVERLRGLYLTSLEVGLKQWLQRELEGYENDAALPWYRIIECRQRGLFQHAINGRQQTCQINEQTLSQRDLAQIRFIFLRGPLIAYLDCHALVLERWPKKAELIDAGNKNGGLIIIGSHVKKTTQQLEELKKSSYVKFIEFNHLLVLEPEKLEAELTRIITETEDAIRQGQTVAVFTGRKRLDVGSEEESLKVSVKISEAITSIVRRLSIKPAFLIAKGGITSSDVGTKGLGVKKALVLGQAAPGIPVWKTGKESKFPDMAYVIFPGNVGGIDTLRKVVDMLNDR